jgi:hypothetical protein
VDDLPADQVQVQIILRRPLKSRMDKAYISSRTSSYPTAVVLIRTSQVIEYMENIPKGCAISSPAARKPR